MVFVQTLEPGKVDCNFCVEQMLTIGSDPLQTMIASIVRSFVIFYDTDERGCEHAIPAKPSPAPIRNSI